MAKRKHPVEICVGIIAALDGLVGHPLVDMDDQRQAFGLALQVQQLREKYQDRLYDQHHEEIMEGYQLQREE